MTNNTINNVTRELLADLLGNDHDKRIMAERHLLAMLANAPSPAGVDGLEVVAWSEFDGEGGHELRLYENNETFLTDWLACNGDKYADWGEPLCRLSDAKVIIDGLRGEVAELQSMITNLSRAGIRMRTERDQQARRAGELEAALEFACKSLAQVTSSDGSGHADIAVSVLRMAGRKEADASQIVEAYKAGAKWRIDAALSAGKEGE